MFSSIMHLPIYKFDSLEELEQFELGTRSVWMVNMTALCPSMKQLPAAMRLLMLVYVDVSNKASDLEVSSIFCDGNTFCIHIMPRNGSKSTTDGADSYRLLTVRGSQKHDKGLHQV